MIPNKIKKKDGDFLRASFRFPATRALFLEVTVLENPPLPFPDDAAALERIMAGRLLKNDVQHQRPFCPELFDVE